MTYIIFKDVCAWTSDLAAVTYKCPQTCTTLRTINDVKLQTHSGQIGLFFFLSGENCAAGITLKRAAVFPGCADFHLHSLSADSNALSNV